MTETTEPPPSKGLQKATGRDRLDWFAMLDEWGAPQRDYAQIAAWLTEQGVSKWWAQKLIVEYEQARGLREPGVRRDGTFSATASKTINVAAAQVFDAFTDPPIRQQWLPDIPLQERTSSPHRSVRFDVSDGTRLSVDIAAKDPAKTQVSIELARLPDSATAADAKQEWRRRLTELKAMLEDTGER